MTATRQIPVSEGVWEDISDLKRPGQTFDDLLAHMVEQEKKRRFIEDMDRIEAEGDFVELEFDVSDTDESQKLLRVFSLSARKVSELSWKN